MKPRNLPEPTSALAPTLQPATEDLAIGDNAAGQEGSGDAVAPGRREAVASQRRGAGTPRRNGVPASRRRDATAPSSDTAVALTVRLDPEAALDLDRLMLDLRAETGRRLDKAEVVRHLLRLAEVPATPVRNALVRALK